jgi:hypothetical protein
MILDFVSRALHRLPDMFREDPLVRTAVKRRWAFPCFTGLNKGRAVRCRSRSPGRSAPDLATGGESDRICPAHPQRPEWPFSDRLPLIGYVGSSAQDSSKISSVVSRRDG